MRKRIWRKYNKNLVNRGKITFFIDEEVLKAKPAKEKRRGRPRLFSLPLVQLLLILKIQYHLPYRMLEGFAKSILTKLVPAAHLPTYSLIAKRSCQVEVPNLSSRRPQVVLLDASGFKVYGEGEWKVKIHGKSKRRKWLKLHVAVDERTGEIISLELTEPNVADCTMAKALLDKCPRSVQEIKADGGYDTRSVRKAIVGRGAKPLIPPRRNGRIWGQVNRDKALQEIRGLGNDEVAREIWGKLTGYSRRALVESCFSRMKRVCGSTLYSRKIPNQRIEVCLKAYMMNRMLQDKMA